MKYQLIVALRSLQVIGGKLNQSRFLPRVLNSVFIAFLLLSSLTRTAQASPGQPNEKPQQAGTPTPTPTATLTPTPVDCAQISNDLMAYWPADGNAIDLIGGHNGNMINGTAYATGKFGQAFSFDGIDDYIDLGSWFTFQDFTITLWVKPGNTQNVYADIMDNNHRAGINWVIQQNGGATNQYYWGEAFDLTAGAWQQLTVIHDSSGNYREYLNGNLSGSYNWGAINYTSYNYLLFGRWGGGEGRNWKGLMDEVKFYNRALTAAEVSAQFACNTASIIDTPRGYWAFDENSGTIAFDQGSGAHNGTLNGVASWVFGHSYDASLHPTDYALQFNGTNSYVSVTDTFDPTAYTIAVWVKPNTVGRNIFVRTDASGPLSSYSHNIYINANGNFCSYTYDGSLRTVCGTTKVDTSIPRWYHVAGTATNNGQLKLYVNGVQEGTPVNIGTLWTGGDRYYIGSNRASSLGYFSGAIDEVRFYDSALLSTDILALYKADQSIINVSPGTLIANNVDTAEIQVTLKDPAGNVLANHSLVPGVSGTGNTITPATIQTNSSGMASFTVKSTKAETKTVMIMDQTQGTNLESKPTITFVAGSIDAQKSTLAASATLALSNGTIPVTITITALDSYSNPIANATVAVAATGSAAVAQPVAATDSQGRATATITDTVVENILVSATIDQSPVQQTVNVRFNCYAASDLVIANGDTCNFVSGTYTYNSITIQTGGVLILQGNTSSGQGVVLNANNLTVEPNGAITADGKGYLAGIGPGKGGDGTAQGNRAGGAGHGGAGGVGGFGNTGGITYGDLYAPIQLGSGGGNQGAIGGSMVGGAGGGAIKLVVANTLTVNGSISANGGVGTTNNFAAGGGGAGGSIWIAVSTLSGTGQIRANGGNGLSTTYGFSGGGGGGRIVIDVPVASNSFTGTVSAYGGIGYQPGAAGTFYRVQTDRLIVNNNAQNGAATTLLAADYDFDNLEIKSGGWVKVAGAASNITLTNNSTIVGDGSGRLDVEGTIHAPADFVLSGVTLGILNELEGASTITTQTNGGLELHANSPAHPNGVYSFETITIKSGTFARLISYDNPASTTDYGVTLQVDDLVVENGAFLESNSQGYAAGVGPGKGGDGTAQGNRAGGAGHGGTGGVGGFGNTGGITYGDLYAPIQLGSGGGNQSGFPGGAGGGAIRLVVANILTVNGEIAANGGNGSTNNFAAGGGGSGGSIWITSESLTGNGKIRSIGGNGASTTYGFSGGGAGGRIALYTDILSPTIQLLVQGGTGYQKGGDGTVYLGKLDPLLSTMTIEPTEVVANGSNFATVTIRLKNANDDPIPNRAVEIALASGSALSINNQQAVGQYIAIGTTNSNGVVTATLKTTVAGVRTLKARSGQELIIQQGTVSFIAGPVSSARSGVSSNISRAPADGQTPINIIVVAKDAYSNPIQNASVVLSASGNGIVTQPSGPTNAQGIAVGSVVNNTGEVVIVSAKINGIAIQDEVSVDFRGADMRLLMTAPSVLSVGATIQYQVDVRNIDSLPVQNVSLEVSLPAGITYQSSNASASPSQNGQTLTWALGDIAVGESRVFTIFGSLASTIPLGTVLEAQGVLTSTTTENALENNSATATTQVVDGRLFSSSISPLSKTINANAATSYQILINNEGLLADTFNITVTGLDPSWYTLPETVFNLAPGATMSVDLSLDLSLEPNRCTLPGNIPFSVNVTSSNRTETETAVVKLQLGPVVTDIYPGNNTLFGSRDVSFSWKSDSQSTGILHIRPFGQSGTDTYPTVLSTSHSVTVTGLTRNAKYEWYVEATSDCGTTTTPLQQITIGNGVVFKSHEQSYTIPRDYDQTVLVPVTNQDSKPRNVHLQIEESYDDLLVNFRGSGSIDGDVTLLPGETRSIELAFFAQDAEIKNYDINAILTSTDGIDTVSDLAVIHVKVLFPGDYTVQEIGNDPVLNIATYRLTNHGQPITDLNITAEDPITHLPALVMITPQIYHARVGTGEFLDFKVIPLYSADQVVDSVGGAGNSPGVLARPSQNIVSDIFYDIVTKVANEIQRTQVQKNCDGNVYAVTFDGPISVALPYATWYCPNRPHVDVVLSTPPFVNAGNLLGGMLQMNFSPSPSAEPHSVSISLNGNPVGGMQGIPNGTYSFNLNPSVINTGFITSAQQTISIDASFANFAHYQIGTGGKLVVVLDKVTVFVCAHSAEEARQIAKDTYGLDPVASTMNLQIELPNAGTAVEMDEKGLVNVRAFVGDNLSTYSNLYSVSAEVEYLDQLFTPKESFLLFDDGKTGHADSRANDRYFNAQWLPLYGGEVRLTVTAATGYGLTDTETRTFTVNAQADFEVKNVYIEKITQEGEAVEVGAEVVNNGFTVTGPVTVEFRYYNANDDGVKIGNPIYTSQQELFWNIFDNKFDHGEVVTVKDNTFIAPSTDLYYVEVVVDPQTQP